MKKIFLSIAFLLVSVIGFSQARTLAGFYSNGQLGKKIPDTVFSLNVQTPLFAINDSTFGSHAIDSLRRSSDSVYAYKDGQWNFQYKDSTGGGGSSAFSALTAATTTNNINNTSYNQTWKWDALGGVVGLSISSASTAASGNANNLVKISQTGINSTSGQTTYGLAVENLKSGTTSKNVAFISTAANGTTNVSAVFLGDVGINTTTPGYALDVNGTANVSGALTVGSLSLSTLNWTSSLDGGSGGAAHSIYFYNGGAAGTRTGVSYLTGGLNAGIVNHVYGGLGAPILFSSGVDASTATVANSAVSIFPDNKQMGIGGITPVASAQFEMSSTTKGFLPPRMTGTQAEAIATPAEGLMVYATDGSGSTITVKGWWGWTGSTWQQL